MGSSPRVGILFFSQTGNTELVARTLAEEFASRGCEVDALPVTYPQDREKVGHVGAWLEQCDLVAVGSPVHYFNPVAPVLDFLDVLGAQLARRDARKARKFGFVFCTYGGRRYASSLHQLGKKLVSAKVSVLGGVVVAASSHFPGVEVPEEMARPPGEQARDLVRQFVGGLLVKHQRVRREEAGGQQYTSRAVLARMDEAGWLEKIGGWALGTKLARAALPHVLFVGTGCQRCFNCVAACPTGNITTQPVIQIGENCIKCYQCLEACRYDQLLAPTLALAQVVKKIPSKPPDARHRAFL